MQRLLSNITIKVNACVYLKDPESSDLGKQIIKGSIDLIDEIGFEQFTFRKLASAIGSTEASVYRYFENKHKVLLYLISWYWSWVEYVLVFKLMNVNSAKERLTSALEILTRQVEEDGSIPHINEAKLNRVVISDSSKVYLTKAVDAENKEGVFGGYKALVDRLSEIILELNPKYKYSQMLVSSVIEGAHQQRYFATHIPKLTNVVKGEDSVVEFYKDLVFKAIKK